MKKLLLAVLLWCVPAFAQFVPQPAGSYVNSGSGWAAATSTSTFDAATFTPQPIGLYRLNTTLNQWVPWDGGSSSGAGTVLSFSAGNLSPLFTTSVATSTTTPALTFLLSNAPGKSILGNVSATSGAPAYTTDPQVLTLTANSITSATVTGALLGNANTATSLAGGAALGDLPYQSAVGTTAMLAGRTAATQGILCQIGNGTISAAPIWCNTVGTGSVVLANAPTVTGTWTFSGAVSVVMGTFTRFRTTGTAPTIAVGAAAGTGATATVLAGSTNQAGQITITTAGVPLAGGTLATVTFNGTVTPAPLTVTLMPANAAAATAVTTIFTNIPGTTTWTISTGATIPAVGTLTYFYTVI